jgi:hypothetical protein
MITLYWIYTLHTTVGPVYILGSVHAHMPLRVLGSYLVLAFITSSVRNLDRKYSIRLVPYGGHECGCTTHPSLLFKIRPLIICG